MAVYKVIQDIEAEDKLLGPLTLKGFIYALMAGFLAFINFRILITTGLGPVRWVVILVLFFPMLLLAVLASPLGRDQPTEVWLLSHVRFLLKPRKRIWNQSGISDLVTITVPKRPERRLTKGFSQSEVSSRLQALATTLDSRGWAVKNVNVNLSPTTEYLQNSQEAGSDRLVDASALPQAVPIIEVHPADDILDEINNPTAQKFDQMVKQADVERKKGILDRIKNIVDHEDEEEPKTKKKTWHIDADTQRAIVSHAQREAERNKEDSSINVRVSHAKEVFRAQHTKAPKKPPAVQTPTAPVTVGSQAVNMELAQSGNDFKVSTLEKLANRQPRIRQIGPNELEISLH